MKGIKSILSVVAISAALAVSFSAAAQENANRDENGKVVRGAYETNGFWDNWFLGFNAGVNTVYDNEFLGQFGLGTDLYLGKWITPEFAGRIGWQGLANDPGRTWQWIGTKRPHVSFNYFHADVMVNISNLFSGYKETRFWDIIPYLTTGVGYTGTGSGDGFSEYLKNANSEYLAGAGVVNEFRLGNRVNFNLDLRWLVGAASAYSTRGRFINFPSVMAGFSVALGDKVNFDRHSSITPVVIPIPFTVDQYNALAQRVAELEKENAELKNRIAELEAREPEVVYVDKGVATPAAIYFDLGSTKISDREMAHLEYFADNADKSKGLELVGSADSATGSAKRNDYLAKERAKVVKAALVKAGFDEDSIEVSDQIDLFDVPAKSRVVTIKTK